MLPAGFKPKIPGGERSQTNTLEIAASRIGLRELNDFLNVEFGDKAMRRTVVFERYKYRLEGGGTAAEGDLLKPSFPSYMGLSFCDLSVFVFNFLYRVVCITAVSHCMSSDS
jgi:hypothetical protein